MMAQEYRSLAAFVQRVQRGLTLRRLLQYGVLLLTACLALLFLGIGVQSLVAAVPWVAPLYSLLALGVGFYLLLYGLWPLHRPLSLRQTLTHIEVAYPELHDDLTNAVQLNPVALEGANPHGIALDLVQALHHQTARQVEQCTVSAVVRKYPLVGLARCAGLLLATGLVALLQPHLLSGALHVLLHPISYLPAREITLTLTPLHLTIAAGMHVEVRAQAAGRIPQEMHLLVTHPGQPDRRYPMEPLSHGLFRYTFLKPQAALTFQATADGFLSARGSLEVVPAPAIGHITLQYLFPDYTGFPTRTQEGGGDIQAFPGTQVQLSLRANVPLTHAVLRFDHGQEIPLTMTEPTVQGSVLVMQEGTYTIEIVDTHGFKNMPAPRYTVRILPDLAPTVTIRQPQDGFEVDEATVVQIQYEAEDDFGLQDVSLVYRSAGTVEQRIPLQHGRFANRQVQETFAWDTHQWPFPTGDTVEFFLEVYDNDTISGPKKGVSPTLTLKVRSREQEHQALKQQQEDIAAALLDLLADHLELADQIRAWQEQAHAGQPAPRPEALQQMREQQQAAMERTEQLAQQLAQAMERMPQDPMSTYDTYADMQALQRNLANVQQTLMPQLQQSLQALTPDARSAAPLQAPQQRMEAVVQELERLSALAEQVANGEKLNDVARLSNKLLDQQNKLLSALDNLPPDFAGGPLPPELQKLLDSLQALMQDLMQAMAQLPSMMQDEFLNRQLEAFPLSDMMQQLQELQQKLAAGDLNGAKQLAEQLLKSMASMVAALQNMRQQGRGGAMEAMGQQLMESSNRLTDLVKRQEKVVEDTQDVDQQTLQQLNAAQQQAFEAVQRRLDQEMERLAKLAMDMLQRAGQHPELEAAFPDAYQQFFRQLQAMRTSLQERQVPQAMADLEEATQQLSGMQQQAARLAPSDRTLQQHMAQAQRHLQAAQQALGGLPHDRQAMLTPGQGQQLGQLGERQGGIQQDTQLLHGDIQRLLPLMPSLPAELVQQLHEAMAFMGDAQSALQERSSRQALPPEQDALERLRSADNTLQQAMQAMAQRGEMMGMSLPMLRQAGRLPMPGSMPQANVDERQGGAAGASVRNFHLPTKEAYKVPRILREDVMDALKEGYPERFKEIIEQYYRNIVR